MLPQRRVPRLGPQLLFPRRSSSVLSPRLISSSSSATSNASQEPPSSSSPSPSSPSLEKTYFKITLTRSAIGLGERKKSTLTSLGIHRRLQTVFHPHKPEFAGKILAVKELVRVENVSEEEVRTKEEMRRFRRPPKGFDVVKKLGDGLDDRT